MARDSNPQDVVITGIGMRCAVGNDAAQSCGTIRTGMSRFAKTGNPDGDGGLTVAAVWPELGDRPWIEKTYDLTLQPLHEALWCARIYEGRAWRTRFRAKIGVWFATPAPGREGTRGEDEQRWTREVKLDFAMISPEVFELISFDHAGGFHALSQAARAVQQGRVGLAIVGGVESHVEGQWLHTLAARGAIRSPSHSSGFIPGEAAAFAVIETRQQAEARSATILASIESVFLDREPNPLGPDHPIDAQGLSRPVQKCLASYGAQDISRVISDLNGERWRSLEWSLVETRCLGGLPRELQHWHPADCTGDVGAAGGIVALNICVRAFARRCAGRASILIVSASRSGERAAAVVAPATHR